jgi:hypothetical protein
MWGTKTKRNSLKQKRKSAMLFSKGSLNDSQMTFEMLIQADCQPRILFHWKYSSKLNM